MTRAAIALGGNLGDPQATFAEALAALGRLPATLVLARSHLYLTRAVGGPAQPDFLNAAAVVETRLSAIELLDGLLTIETELGRVRRERHGPRTLDLDLLLYDGARINLERLTVPHPRLVERRFALEPLLEAWPDATLPDGTPLAAVLSTLPAGGVRATHGYNPYPSRPRGDSPCPILKTLRNTTQSSS